MARHLAICERKSAYPSRSEAKSATVTHSMLDVLGLVRKPEEGPSGIRKKIGPAKQEPAPAEEKNDSPQSTEAAVEEATKTVDGCVTEEEKEKDVNKSEESNKDEEDVEEIVEEVETASVVEELEKEDEVRDDNKAEEVGKDVESDRVESEKDEEVDKEQEVQLVDDEPEEIAESSEAVEEEEKQHESTETAESEIGLQTVEKSPEATVVEEKTSEIEKDTEVIDTAVENYTENKEESVEREETTEKLEPVEETSIENAEDIQSVGSHISEEAVCQKELDVPHEPVAAREQVSPVNEMETAEVVQEKTNSLEAEITSDDIQNIISDVVGEKSNADMGFDESANMETETDVTAFSSQRPMEDVVPMQISQDESMEVPETNEVMECEETPMETD